MRITRPELRDILGAPHYVETDSLRTYGGEEDSWAFTLSSGQRVVVVLRVPYEGAVLYGDPPELPPILTMLGLATDDSRVFPYTEPFQQT